MFWGFVLRLLVGAFLAPIVFSFMVVPLLGLLSLTVRKDASKLSPIGYPIFALLFLAQFYFWGMWAAYCAALAVFRAPDVTHAWLYYIVAFLFVTAPVGYLTSKELASAGSVREVRGIQGGATLYSGFAIVAFVAFSVWPGLMVFPYGWFIGLTVPTEGRAARALEEQYFRTLDGWVTRGGPIEEVQGTVVWTCGKLVMLDATPSEKVRLSTSEREEFHFRVDVCMQMTVNRVHPQPVLQKKEMVTMICDTSGRPLFTRLCKQSGLR